MNYNKKEKILGQWNFSYMEHWDYINTNTEVKSSSDIKKLGLKSYDITIPGNFLIELQKNGIIDDLYFGENILKAQDFEETHVFYSVEFDFHKSKNDVQNLLFDGLDVFSEIYLNGNLVLKTDNMFIPYEIGTELLHEGRNEILVHVLPMLIEAKKTPCSAGEIAMSYNYPSLNVRMAAHMLGWDITPRIIHAGIWRPVYLVTHPKNHIFETYLYTLRADVKSKNATLCLFYNTEINESIKGYKIVCEGSCGDSTFKAESKMWFSSGKIVMNINNAKFWWIKGRGEANLYKINVRLEKDGVIVDSKEFNLGIRTVEMFQKSSLDKEHHGKFQIILNGEKIFIKGTNWVPSDAYHSNAASRIPKILELIDDIGCNTIRCWGGNVYEDDLFFNICDEKGILVWQDFAMACGTYPQHEEMQNKIRNEAEIIVKKLRQHPSLCIWAGDNECDMAYAEFLGINPNQNILTRKIIPEVLLTHDPKAPYLPSSPYYNEETYTNNLPLAEEHLWGPRDYFKSDFYKNNKAAFASEIGYHGCPSPASVEKFISKENLFPYNNFEWTLHAASPEKEMSGDFTYRIKLMADQIKTLVDQIPDNLEDFSLLSQISQLEACKYYIEQFRINKWDKTGIIWWNIIDAWPQFSDAVVDYYFEKKLAYYFIKRVQAPVCLMMSGDFEKEIELFCSNDMNVDAEVSFEVFEVTNTSLIPIMSDSVTVSADTSMKIRSFGDVDGQSLYLIRWHDQVNGSGYNHFLAGTPPYDMNDLFQKFHLAGLFDEIDLSVFCLEFFKKTAV